MLSLTNRKKYLANRNQIQQPNNKNKKAILMGLNYPGTRFSLKGCINDVRSGARYLKKQQYDTKVLIDKNITIEYNLLEALTELKDSGVKTVLFHYSGHGSQILDQTGDEVDKWDETVF